MEQYIITLYNLMMEQWTRVVHTCAVMSSPISQPSPPDWLVTHCWPLLALDNADLITKSSSSQHIFSRLLPQMWDWWTGGGNENLIFSTSADTNCNLLFYFTQNTHFNISTSIWDFYWNNDLIVPDLSLIYCRIETCINQSRISHITSIATIFLFVSESCSWVMNSSPMILFLVSLSTLPSLRALNTGKKQQRLHS